MDKHLRIVAEAHPETRIVKLNSQKAPFFVGKLQIQTLPTLVCFKEGVTIGKIVGFEGLAAADKPDEFPTYRLARKMCEIGVLMIRNSKEDYNQHENSSQSDQEPSDLEEDEEEKF